MIQNAGAGIFGSVEEVPLADARWQWQVLVEGPLQLLKLAAAHLRPRGEGLIIGVSSLAAEMPLPFSIHYSAGKAAFSALLAGLSMELKPFHVKVVDLRPGDICTAFLDQLPKTMPADSGLSSLGHASVEGKHFPDAACSVTGSYRARDSGHYPGRKDTRSCS